MNEKNLNIVVTDNDNRDSIAFPVTPEKLGKFISGLLGQSQTIEREVAGIFDVDLTWFLHVHALIEQRIKQQNDATRTAFKATIYYEDNLTRTVESYEAFEHFQETKKIRSTGVKIEWSYLILFPGKELPERQEITLHASERGSRYLISGLPVQKQRVTGGLGLVTYSIDHTERTWGDDIEAILRQEIDQVTKRTLWYEKYFENAMMLLGLALFLGGFLFPDYMNDRLQRQSVQKLQSVISHVATPSELPTLDASKKLDLVIRLLDPQNQVAKVGIKYRVVSAISGFALLFWCIYLSEMRRSSFVVLTREAEIHRTRTLSKEGRRILIAALSFAASIGAGVLANYVYLYLTT